jgi:hypothetical protein
MTTTLIDQTAATAVVDWGDGLGPVSYASEATAQKLLSWSDYSAGTLTSKGYRQAVITIAPQAGQLLTSAYTFASEAPT